MKTTLNLVLLAGLASTSSAETSGIPPYQAPKPGDLRGPCPGLNTLANHGLLPRDGKNITAAMLESAFHKGLNQDRSLSQTLFRAAAFTNPSGDMTSFSLSDLGRHGILEHDASLSRVDAAFGDPSAFDQSVFDRTLSAWTGDTIDIKAAAAARILQVRYSQANNPSYDMNIIAQAFSKGESTAPILVFGDIKAGTAPKADVVYWFKHEQFPPNYKPQAKAVTMDDLQDLQDRLNKELVAQGLDMAAPAPAPTGAPAAPTGAPLSRPSSASKAAAAKKAKVKVAGAPVSEPTSAPKAAARAAARRSAHGMRKW